MGNISNSFSGRYERVLVAGGGAMAIEHHVPRLLRFLGSEHISIVETDSFRRTELAARFEKNHRIKLLERPPREGDLDLVVIATPPKFHYQYYDELEDSSDCFLIEKPMTLNVEQALLLENSSVSKGKKVFVNQIRRTLSSYPLMRQFYREGYFGKLKKVAVNEGGVFNWKAVSRGSFSKDLNGGGVLMDTGPHTLDLLFRVFENMSLESAYMDGIGKSVEANCTLNLLADEDVPVTLSLSRNRHLSNTMIFEFAQATCTADVRGAGIEIVTSEGMQFVIYPSHTQASKPVNFAGLLDAFYEGFLVPCENTGVGPSESVRVLRVIDAAYTCAQPMKGVFK